MMRKYFEMMTWFIYQFGCFSGPRLYAANAKYLITLNRSIVSLMQPHCLWLLECVGAVAVIVVNCCRICSCPGCSTGISHSFFREILEVSPTFCIRGLLWLETRIPLPTGVFWPNLYLFWQPTVFNMDTSFFSLNPCFASPYSLHSLAKSWEPSDLVICIEKTCRSICKEG